MTQRTWGGDTLRVVELEHDAVGVGGDEKDSIAAELVRYADRFGTRWGRGDIPDTKPAIIRLMAGDSGLIVQPSAVGEDDGRRFDTFDRGGVPLGQAVLDVVLITHPVRPIFAGDYVVGVALSESSIPQVVRARRSLALLP